MGPTQGRTVTFTVVRPSDRHDFSTGLTFLHNFGAYMPANVAGKVSPIECFWITLGMTEVL